MPSGFTHDFVQATQSITLKRKYIEMKILYIYKLSSDVVFCRARLVNFSVPQSIPLMLLEKSVSLDSIYLK